MTHSNQGMNKPRNNPARKERRCLKCGEMFMSEGPQFRLCCHRQKETKYEAWIGGYEYKFPTQRHTGQRVSQ